MEKLKAGIFDGTQFCKLIRDQEFENSMNREKLKAWKAFVQVVQNFFGNGKACNYKKFFSAICWLLWTTMDAKRTSQCATCSHILIGFLSWESWISEWWAEEQFHQDLKEMESRYQGRWDKVMMADYCWTLTRDFPAADHSRSSKKRKFKPWISNNDDVICNLPVLALIKVNIWNFYCMKHLLENWFLC